MIFSNIILALEIWAVTFLWFQIVQKPVFGFFNRRQSSRHIGVSDVIGVYRHGAVSDAMISSYVAALPLIFGTIRIFSPGFCLYGVLLAYFIVISLALGLLATADTVLYSFWKSKMDASVFMYLRSIKGATASVSWRYLCCAILAWLMLSATYFACVSFMMKYLAKFFSFPDARPDVIGTVIVTACFILSVGVLFAIIRGLGIRPRNPSAVYFSSNMFLNHWALNPGFQMIYSLSTSEDAGKMHRYFHDAEVVDNIKRIFPTSGKTERSILTETRPNILLVVWESFSASFSSHFGNKENVTPKFDSLANEGVLFTGCHAGAFRTDRGIVCVNSGFPAQPTMSIIRYTRKLPFLPSLAKSMRKNGYNTLAIQGGDLSIMHKSDYYLANGYERILGIEAFPKDSPMCKWGVHDGAVMDFTFNEMLRMSKNSERPFFINLLTLSSHEPFEVPYKRLDNMMDNAFAYTDHCLGELVDKLKKSHLWDNLLVIVVADHGVNLPGPVDDHSEQSRIPILFTGGVVNGAAKVSTIMSQTDIAATLLGQLGIEHSDFKYSRDVLADSYKDPFAFHIFQNGATIVDGNGHTSIDTQVDRIVDGEMDEYRLKRIRTVLQSVHTDISHM